MIKFNKVPYTGNEVRYIEEAIAAGKLCGDGVFTKKDSAWFEEKTGAAKALLTTSCSTALDMSAILAEIEPGDEVILPSYT